jgi:hypothetical protein
MINGENLCVFFLTFKIKLLYSQLILSYKNNVTSVMLCLK